MSIIVIIEVLSFPVFFCLFVFSLLSCNWGCVSFISNPLCFPLHQWGWPNRWNTVAAWTISICISQKRCCTMTIVLVLFTLSLLFAIWELFWETLLGTWVLHLCEWPPVTPPTVTDWINIITTSAMFHFILLRWILSPCGGQGHIRWGWRGEPVLAVHSDTGDHSGGPLLGSLLVP